MIRISFSILTLALAAGSAVAQTPGQTPVDAPQATVEASQAAFSLDTPIEALAADAEARAVLERELPGLIGHERYEQFKTMSLKTLQPFSGGLITAERLTAVEAALAELAKSSDTPTETE